MVDRCLARNSVVGRPEIIVRVSRYSHSALSWQSVPVILHPLAHEYNQGVSFVSSSSSSRALRLHSFCPHFHFLIALCYPVAIVAKVPDPLQGMYDAVFRPTQSRSSVGPPQAAAKTPDAFLPDERLTLEEAVWIYTAGGAIAAGEEKRLGAIQPGFMADLTVLEIEGGAEKLLEDAR